MDINQSPIAMFDHVRIHNTPLTHEKKVADLIGVVYGITTPSNPEYRKSIDGEIIGELTEDRAYNIHFEKINETKWFASHLVDFVDHNPGFEINIASVKAIRLENGEWQEQSETKPGRKFQNYSEMMLANIKEQDISMSKKIWNWLKKIFFPN